MKKKKYNSPASKIIEVRVQLLIAISSNVDIRDGGGGNGENRSREADFFDED
jgi:hypothetical protein